MLILKFLANLMHAIMACWKVLWLAFDGQMLHYTRKLFAKALKSSLLDIPRGWNLYTLGIDFEERNTRLNANCVCLYPPLAYLASLQKVQI